ncbi:STAS-like domain-containing protein [Roseibacillus persicicus]|uniref:STAS-like domain-containing protein n=1 Tax=Roseibacillus persicicus TaxID=454148 RepID=UPI003CE50F37
MGDGTKGNLFRCEKVEPFWNEADQIVLNFEGIHSMTHSFVNAFVGNLAEQHPSDFRKKLVFRNCSPLVRTFIKGALSHAKKRMAT